ncbi:hemicentin-1-like isoform X2 [Mya arenaria]|uniref:hemicentin-1-like isoform X2 n=1 Tax=Mya arenaria TaxID=6604 RepID=UPI0022E649CB|nr:hemicentin-1-like isoform X2 [Mya arenaria]
MRIVVLIVIFVMIFVIYSDALTANLTHRPSPALENSPVTLTCSYTGLQADESLSRTTWSVMSPNETVGTEGRIILPSCSPFGFIDPSLYNYSCANGYINWTIRNISRMNDKELWFCLIVTSLQSQQAFDTLNVQVPITSVSLTEPTDSTVTMDAGTSEKFICRTSGGLPQATIKWFKVAGGTCSQSGMAITSSVSIPTVSVLDGLKLVESTLTFTASRKDDGLRICCSASNVAEEHRVSETKRVDVRYAPSDPPVIEGYASGSTFSMIENSTESLTCRSTGGNPLATVTWNCFNNQMSSPIEQGSTVKRTVQWTAKRNENARCTCTASHVTRPNQLQSAFVNVNILYPPSSPLFRVANTDVGSSIKILTDSSQTVECTSSGNPSPATSDFTWRMGTSEMSTGSVLNWQGGIKVGDEDSYTCTVETTLTPSDQSKDAKVATSSSTVEITVLYPPELPTLHWDSSSGPVIDGPLTLVVQRLFTLACVASSKPPANYTWTGGVNVVHGQLLQDTLTAKVNTTRTCTARNILNPTVGAARAMSSSATITLNINYPPESVSIRHESVSGTVIQSEFRVIEGNSTKLYCTVQSQPASSFRWSGADIHSLDPPKLHTITRRNALEGNIVLIQCLFTAGNPITTRSTFTRAVDGTSWSGDSHTFQSIHREDAGLYRCTVENSMDPTGAEIQTGNDTADFEINVWYNTSILRFDVSTFPNQNIITVNESERLLIVCEVLSNPDSTIRLKENHMATILLERENVLEVEYVIQNTSCSDSAVYTCSAFNNYTAMERVPFKELQLFVQCSPRPSKHQSHLRRNFTGFLHGNVTFVLMVDAYPLPEFKWQRWNGTFYTEVNGENYVIFSSYLFTSLTILDIKGDSFVPYAVQVSNGIQPNLQEIFYLNHEESGHSNRASVIGGVVGGCLFILVVVVLSVIILKRKYNCCIKKSTKEDGQPGKCVQVPDNPGFAAAVTYEARTATQETSEYDALNAENDRPDKSHVYMSVVDSTSTPSPHYENSKTEDPVYNNTMLQNSVQTVL